MACLSGSFLTDDGVDITKHDESSDCEICPKGKYSENEAAALCVVCGDGKYLDDDARSTALHDGESDCTHCVAGTSTVPGR